MSLRLVYFYLCTYKHTYEIHSIELSKRQKNITLVLLVLKLVQVLTKMASFWELFKKHLLDFCRESNLHGLQHISAEYSTRLEK